MGNPSGCSISQCTWQPLLGCQEGVRLGLPLGLFAAFAFTMNISSNHHYFSGSCRNRAWFSTGIAVSKTFDSLIEPIS